MSAVLAIFFVVFLLAFALFVGGFLLIAFLTGFDRPHLHWWEEKP